ncbi:MAG TPA: response regulator [Terriglobales bacterium]|nr:response regulator [Terriglobales bacterium]
MQNDAAAHSLANIPMVFPKALAIGKRILVVEDNTFVREITSEILERAGCYVLKARNAASAKSASEYRQIQLLITDVVLPGQNGCQLADDLRKTNPGMKVILMSGYPGNAIAGKITENNEIAFLPKPFSAEALLRAVGRMLDNSGLVVV